MVSVPGFVVPLQVPAPKAYVLNYRVPNSRLCILIRAIKTLKPSFPYTLAASCHTAQGPRRAPLSSDHVLVCPAPRKYVELECFGSGFSLAARFVVRFSDSSGKPSVCERVSGPRSASDPKTLKLFTVHVGWSVGLSM